MPAQAYIQVRIDAKTKRETQAVLTDIGLDLSTAVKMLCKQISFTGTLPFAIRDVNGMRPAEAGYLREARIGVREGKKFSDAKELLADLNS